MATCASEPATRQCRTCAEMRSVSDFREGNRSCRTCANVRALARRRRRLYGDANAPDRRGGRLVHGFARKKGLKAPEYSVWASMIQRCHNPKDKGFRNYGARGIYVCREWRESFVAFISDMGRRPSSQHSIERVDNDGPYAPGNCCWAVVAEQRRNHRRNRRISDHGRSLTITDWSRELGIPLSTLRYRHRAGLWPSFNPDLAVTALSTSLVPTDPKASALVGGVDACSPKEA